jgi:hypothetical protein
VTTIVSNRDRKSLSSIERSLKRGTRSFKELVAGSGGLFPTDVLQFLEAHRANDAFDRAAIDNMIAEARFADATTGLPQGHGLALPHPLDAEWRFTDVTAQALLDLAIAATGPSDLILLIGVPSVTVAAAARNDDRRYWVCGEKNVITDGLISHTVSDPRFRHGRIDGAEAGAAIVDPPWYLPQFQQMLGQASHHCRHGGSIFVSSPGGHCPNHRNRLAGRSRIRWRS